jgi:sigma-B regulation protein RsbU (phosphoserine phosphatase)
MCTIELEPNHAGVCLEIVNAGGIPPFIKRCNGPVEHPLVGGFALGQELGAEAGYQQHSLALNRGDLIILTTDGVVEANNGNGNMLGFEQLEAIISAGPTTNANDMLAHLTSALSRFTGDAEQHDDFTIVIIQV